MITHLLKLISLFIFVFLISLYIPQQTITPKILIKPLLSIDHTSSHVEYVSSELQTMNISQKFVFPLNSLKDSTQYQLLQLKNNMTYSLGHFPDFSDISSKKSTNGYVTYPDSFSYFIWYPKIGNNILFFDQNLNLLWSKRESRYIKVFPDGNYLLVISGDQSKFEILDIEMSSFFSYSGLLLTHYQLFSSQSKLSQKWNACFAFLNGDILLIDTHSQVSYLYHHNNVIKSTFCDPQHEIILLHTQDLQKKQDFIELYSINQNSFKKQKNSAFTNTKIKPLLLKLKQKILMPKIIPSKIPLLTTTENIIYVTQAKKSLNIHFVNYVNNNKYYIDIFTEDLFILEDFRFQTTLDTIILSNSYDLIILDSKGLLFHNNFDHILNITTDTYQIFIQENKRLASYIIK